MLSGSIDSTFVEFQFIFSYKNLFCQSGRNRPLNNTQRSPTESHYYYNGVRLISSVLDGHGRFKLYTKENVKHSVRISIPNKAMLL